MAVLVAKRSWGFTRPPLGATIDYGNPLAERLTFFGCDQANGIYYDHVSGLSRWSTGVGFHQASPFSGTSLAGNQMEMTTFTGASTTGWNFGNLAGTDMTDSFTVMVWAMPNSTNIVAAAKDSNGSGRNWTFFTAANSGATFYNAGGGGGTPSSSGITVPSGKLAQYVCVFNKVTGVVSFYIDGVPAGSGTTGAASATTANFWVGRRDYTGAEQYFIGGVPITAIWRRMLQPPEVADLYKSPYGVFVPPGRMSSRYLNLIISTTNVKTVGGLAQASVKTIDGLAIASVKTIEGLA